MSKEIKRYRVYVAGPLTQGDRRTNVRIAIDAAQRIAERGHFPFVPHLFEFWSYIYLENTYDFWMNLDLEFLKQCQILVRLPGPSKGADLEVSTALDINIPVYFGLDEFMTSPHWAQEVP